MPVPSEDLKAYLTHPTGPGGNSSQGDPDESLGGFRSSTEVNTDTPLGNLFSTRFAIGTYHRCFFIVNESETFSMDPVLKWGSLYPGQDGINVSYGLDPTGVVPEDSSDPQAVEISEEGEAPSGVSFSVPTSDANALQVGELGPGEGRAIWVRLEVTQDASNQPFQIQSESFIQARKVQP